jgi:TorA maturation chaperone TorD
MNIEGFFAYEKARGNAFNLLAECYLMPGQNILGKSRKLIDVLHFVYPEVTGHIQEFQIQCKNDFDIERLKVDYARLFVGPYSLLAPPYGSVYMEDARRIMGDSTLHALEMYRETGLDMAQDFNDAPDHIAVELEFMYYLVFKEVGAMADQNYTIAADYVEKQKIFLEAHIGAWISEFSAHIMENAETEFYRSLSTLTTRFVRKNLESMLQISLQQINGFMSLKVAEDKKALI